MEKIDSRLHKRQIELMKRRFDVDEENKIVKLDVSYEKAEDILEGNLDTYTPAFDREKFGRIKEIIGDFPHEYKADLNIKIDDYQNYKPEEMLEGFNDAVELTFYSGNKEHKKKWVQIVFLLIAGILLLSIMAKGVIENWLNLSETQSSVFKEVFDITSWVFIWQAVSLLFLTPSEDRLVSLTLVSRLRNVCFLDKNGKVLVSEDYRDSYENTAQEKKVRIVGKYSLLISGAAFFGLGASGLISALISIPETFAPIEGEYVSIAVALNVIFFVISLSIVLFEILGGLAAISSFTGKVGKLYKMVLPFGIIVFSIESLNLVLSITMGSYNVVTPVIGLLVASAYIMGAIFLLVTREKPAKKQAK